MKKLALLFFVFHFSFFTFHLCEAQVINVPGDYPTIQQGIEAADHGDTVLVAENTYYENISFLGKAILVGSEFIIDGDTSHITNTIIDGSQPVDPDYGSVVMFRSGEDTTSVLCGFTLTGGTGTIEPGVDYRMGGGVQISWSGAKLLNNIIRDNIVSYNTAAYGGGVQAGGPMDILPWVVMRNNRISKNKALSSGVYAMGGGIAVFYNLILINNEISNNELNCPSGCDGGGASLSAVFSPTRLDVRNNLITHNKAVSLSISSQYTIGAGLVVAFESSGIVSGNDISYNQLESADGTYGQASGVLVQQVIADDFLFENNFITNNTHVGEFCLGGGLLIYDCGGKFQNNVVQNNTATHGAGIYIEDGPDHQPEIINNTVTGNTATTGGGGLYIKNASANVFNTIIWGNSAPNGASIFEESSTLEVRYSDVKGDQPWPGEGNINVDPQLLEDGYHIDQFSPCEDQGSNSEMINDSLLYAPPYDFEGTLRPWHLGVDIGADECDIITGLSGQSPAASRQSSVVSYPNPTRGIVDFRFSVADAGRVTFKIYDIEGREVSIVLDENLPAVEHTVKWDASALPPGVYTCRISTIDNRQSAIGKLVKY